LRRTRIAWGITGAGDYLAETMSIVKGIAEKDHVEVAVILSKNGQIVVKWYKLWDELASSFRTVKVEKGPNQPFVAGPLQVGRYSMLFVSPATANTVAKIVHGIADSLITNCVSQAVKGGTPVYIFPVDQKLGTVTTRIPGGKEIEIRTREVDVENVERLREMEGITVLRHPAEIEAVVSSIAPDEGR
jgi:archaeoflavoprotein AfpA